MREDMESGTDVDFTLKAEGETLGFKVSVRHAPKCL